MAAEDNDLRVYIGDMTLQLARLARANELDTLAFLLEVATLEANESEKNKRDARSG